jgi:hypothetical protein
VTAIAIIAVGYLPKANSFSGFKGKTLWDWLSLLVVPASLAGLGALLQLKEQRRAKEQAELEREIADQNRQEEALQHYLDRVSNLLIEKNLLAIAVKVGNEKNTPDEKELLDVSVDIIRTMTLTTLRRSDGDRKTSIVRFLIEAGIIRQLGVRLEGADLSGTNLWHINLSGANLSITNFSGTNLSDADLSGSNLSGANLEDVNFSSADLFGAKGLFKEQLESAYLCKTTLPEGINLDPNRDCDTDYDTWLKKRSGTSTQIQQPS